MSEPTKKESLMKRLQAIIDGGKKIVALDLTTSTGVIVTFPDLKEGEVPSEGSVATIDGKPVPDGVITIVNKEEQYDLEFVDGKVAVTVPNEEMIKLMEENASLLEENASLNARLTAMEAEVTAVLSEMTSEEPPVKKPTATKLPADNPENLRKRLQALKDAKVKRNRPT